MGVLSHFHSPISLKFKKHLFISVASGLAEMGILKLKTFFKRLLLPPLDYLDAGSVLC